MKFPKKGEGMKNVKNTHYIPPELDIVTFDCNDIVTASGYVSDENVDDEW